MTIEKAEGELETIDSTPEHPFYVEGKGWVEASSLHPGMTIWFANGTKGTVEDIANEGLEEPVTVYNFEVKDFHTYFVGECGVLVHNMCAKASNGQDNLVADNENKRTSGVPVAERTTAANGLDYQSNPKHTPGQPGNRPNAGIEPQNSLDLFAASVQSSQNPNQRFTYDGETGTLHRFYNDGNDTWHWSGSTNQGENSLKGSQVPSDIKKTLGLPKKGW